jgi:pimeloyl-ACP methyl ester carboxylesterase
MKIAEPFMTADFSQLPQVLWPGFESLASIPVLIVRGALSEVLSEQTLAEMQRRLPTAEVVTVEGVGHAPTLGEPVAVAAIDRLLSRIA